MTYGRTLLRTSQAGRGRRRRDDCRFRMNGGVPAEAAVAVARDEAQASGEY
jgi:hypothetical protein